MQMARILHHKGSLLRCILRNIWSHIGPGINLALLINECQNCQVLIGLTRTAHYGATIHPSSRKAMGNQLTSPPRVSAGGVGRGRS